MYRPTIRPPLPTEPFSSTDTVTAGPLSVKFAGLGAGSAVKWDRLYLDGTGNVVRHESGLSAADALPADTLSVCVRGAVSPLRSGTYYQTIALKLVV